METFLIAVGAMIPMLVVLVVVHEFGHYATARKLGVKVLEFGVGFPPRAYTLYTGKTRVLISPDTRFINLSGPSDIQLGSLVKVSSGEDSQGNLVARVIELPPAAKSLIARLSGKAKSDEVSAPVEPEVIPDSDELLKHEGKVRAVENGSIVLADMLYTMNWAPLGGFVRLAGESNPAVPRSLAGKGTRQTRVHQALEQRRAVRLQHRLPLVSGDRRSVRVRHRRPRRRRNGEGQSDQRRPGSEEDQDGHARRGRLSEGTTQGRRRQRISHLLLPTPRLITPVGRTSSGSLSTIKNSPS